jgi:hypothetical protein
LIWEADQSERFARVRLRILLPTREDSRRRMAGGELRLGTVSMYMGYTDRQNNLLFWMEPSIYMGTHTSSFFLVPDYRVLS